MSRLAHGSFVCIVPITKRQPNCKSTAFSNSTTTHFAEAIEVPFKDSLYLVFSTHFEGGEREHLRDLITNCHQTLDELFRNNVEKIRMTELMTEDAIQFFEDHRASNMMEESKPEYFGINGISLETLRSDEATIRDLLRYKPNVSQSDPESIRSFHRLRLKIKSNKPNLNTASLKHPSMFTRVVNIMSTIWPMLKHLLSTFLWFGRANRPTDTLPHPKQNTTIASVIPTPSGRIRSVMALAHPIDPAISENKEALKAMRYVFRAFEFAGKHIFTNGHLTNVDTVYSARFVLANFQKTTSTAPDFILFFSRFNGDAGRYVDDFIFQTAGTLSIFWVWCRGFPSWKFNAKPPIKEILKIFRKQPPHLFDGGANSGDQFKTFLRSGNQPLILQYSHKQYLNRTVQSIRRHREVCSTLTRQPTTQHDTIDWIQKIY